jgi:hypothetical protein
MKIYTINTPNGQIGEETTSSDAYVAILEFISTLVVDSCKMVEYIDELHETYQINPDHFGVTGVVWCDYVEMDKTDETNKEAKSSAYLDKAHFCTHLEKIINICKNENKAINAVVNLFGDEAEYFFDAFTGLSLAADLLEEMVGDISGAIRYLIDECECDFDRFYQGIDEDFEIKSCSDFYDYIVKYCRTEVEE